MHSEEAITKKIGDFYDSSAITKFWSYLKRNQMHVGYWDNHHPYKNDLYEGAVRFTEYMISMTNIKDGELFIDIGCGYGVPAIALAQKKNCRVVGVTASENQRDYAAVLVEENKLESQVNFLVADANHLPFPNDTFDGGWFFESIFHMGHETALDEAHRILKNGAEILIADFVKTNELTKDEMNFLKENIGINSAIAINDYPQVLQKKGFSLIELKDVTKNTIDCEQRWKVHLDIINNRPPDFFDSISPKTIIFMKDFFSKLHEIGKKAIGYCVVKAVNKK